MANPDFEYAHTYEECDPGFVLLSMSSKKRHLIEQAITLRGCKKIKNIDKQLGEKGLFKKSLSLFSWQLHYLFLISLK